MKVISTLTKKIFDSINADIPKDFDIVFPETLDSEGILNQCQDADFFIAVGSAFRLTETELKRLTHLKLISTLGVGYDHIDVDACHRLSIPVANTRGTNASSVAEHAIGGVIALQRRFIESDRAIKNGQYKEFRMNLLREGYHELCGSTVGIIGMGNIGKRFAAMANVMGSKVIYTADKRLLPEEEETLAVTYVPQDDIWGQCDVISLHLPLTPATKHLVNEKILSQMKKGAILVNTARGAVIDVAAVASSLENGHLGGAVIDTFEPEPPEASYPLLNLSPLAADKVILTPHTAGVTLEAYKRMVEGAFKNMTDILEGKKPENLL